MAKYGSDRSFDTTLALTPYDHFETLAGFGKFMQDCPKSLHKRGASASDDKADASYWRAQRERRGDMDDAQFAFMSGWAGEGTQRGLELCSTGDDRMVKYAQQLLDKVMADLEVPWEVYRNSMAGGFADGAAAAMGRHDAMKQREHDETTKSTLAPVKIWVCLTCSAGIPVADVVKRGVAILALAMAVSTKRSLDLNVFNIFGCDNEAGGCITSIQLNTKPLDLASAAFAIASPTLFRGMMYPFADWQHKGNGHWPRGYDYKWSEERPDGSYADSPWLRQIRQIVGAPAHDLFIEPVELGQPVLIDPIGWINKQVMRFNSDAYEGQSQA